jgi:hypothetical protein
VADVLAFDEASISARWWRYGLKPFQRLNTGLLVDTNGNLSPLGNEYRVDLNDVAHPLVEVGVFAVQPHSEFRGA